MCSLVKYIDNLDKRMSWSTKSNALLKSSKMASIILPFSISFSQQSVYSVDKQTDFCITDFTGLIFYHFSRPSAAASGLLAHIIVGLPFEPAPHGVPSQCVWISCSVTTALFLYLAIINQCFFNNLTTKRLLHFLTTSSSVIYWNKTDKRTQKKKTRKNT